MKLKSIFFSTLLVLFFTSIKSQSPLRDRWDTLYANVTTNYVDTFYYNQNGNTTILNNLIIYGDSVNIETFIESSFIHRFNVNNNTLSKIYYPKFSTDRGIKTAAVAPTGTAGPAYVFFGAKANYSTLDSTLILYRLNAQSNAVITETAYTGTGDYRSGVYNMCFYSPASNHDTLIIFNHRGNAIHLDSVNIFKKHYNQTGIINTNKSLPVTASDIYATFIFNNVLYVSGKTYSSENFILNSTNGTTYSVNAGFAASTYSDMPVMHMDTLNGYLYLSLDAGDGAYQIIKTNNGVNYTQVVSYSQGFVSSMKHFKNKLYFTLQNNVPNGGARPDIKYLSANDAVTLSKDTLGRYYNESYTFDLSVVSNSLLLSGNYLDWSNYHYGEFIYKLMLPVANFSITGTNWCLNQPYTLVSQSLNADSVRWIKDLNFNASVTNTYAVSFNTTGSHTIGLIAINGTQKDTLKYTLNVYGFMVNISGPANLCLNVPTTYSVSSTGAIGTVTNVLNATGISLSSSGQNTVAISATTTGAYNYSITVTDANNCSYTSSNYSVTVLSDKDISGTITHSSIAVAGEITLYRYEPVLTKFDSITTVTPDAGGQFIFTARKADTYILKGIPTNNSLQVTYAPNAISWQNATIITHGCTNNTSQNINVVAIANIGTGPGILSGKIVEGQGYGQKGFGTVVPGNPIKGIIVKGGRNPGGEIVAQSRTNASGEYTLSSLPLNANGESYFLIVDIPGLDTSATYYRNISSTSSAYTDLDFAVDSMYIKPLQTVNIKELSLNHQIIKLYPNPANNRLTIEVPALQSPELNFELTDLNGRSLKFISAKNEKTNADFSTVIDLTDLPEGVYILKIKGERTLHHEKIIISR